MLDVPLPPEQVALLEWMIERSRDPGPNRFLYVNIGDGLYHHAGPPQSRRTQGRTDADVLVRAGLVDSRTNSKGNPEYWVLPKGYAYHEQTRRPKNPIEAAWRWAHRWRTRLTLGAIGVLIALGVLLLDLLRFVRGE